MAVRSDRTCVWAQHTVFVERRSEIQAELKRAGIPTAVHYPRPIHRLPAYAGVAQADGCLHSVRAAEQVLSLPMSADLTETDQDRIAAAAPAS